MQDEQNTIVPEGQSEPEAEVSATTQGSETPGEGTVPGQPGSQEGDTNPENGNAEQQAEVESEDRGESQGENTETPANPPAGDGTAPAEAGDVTPADSVQPENEAAETQPTGTDEVQGSENVRFDEEGRQIATEEEKAELKSLEFKRTQMPVTGDDIARIDYLNTLKHD